MTQALSLPDAIDPEQWHAIATLITFAGASLLAAAEIFVTEDKELARLQPGQLAMYWADGDKRNGLYEGTDPATTGGFVARQLWKIR